MSCLWNAGAQEALRASIAGSESARARREAMGSIGYYNLKMGPVGLRAATGLAMDFTDNVNLGGADTEGDLIIRPSVNTQLIWPMTDRNVLNLNVQVGYSAYMENSQLNQLYITPGTELSFDFFVGDFVINVHDRPSLTQNAYQDPTVVGTGDYAQFQNEAGVSVLWDLNKAVLSTGYDHVNYLSLTSESRRPDGESELFYLSGGWRVQPEMLLGLVAGSGLIRYTSDLSPDATQWSVGGFYSWQLSQYLRGRADVGYTVYTPDAPGFKEVSGVYARLSLDHRLNRLVSYTLSGGRTLNLSFYGGAYELYTVNLNLNWNLVRKVGMATSFWYEHGTQPYASPEVFDRFGAGVSFGRTLTRKLSGHLGYQYILRLSNLPNGEYTINTVSLSFNYRF